MKQKSLVYEESPGNESEPQTIWRSLSGTRSWISLAIAGALLLFSNGARNVPLAAWFAPLFLLRFVRSQSVKIGLPIAYVLLTAAFAFQFRGMVPIPGVAYLIFLVAWGIPLVLPYIIDRLVAHRLTGFKTTLVFPAAWATTEYLLSRGPYGSWGSTAYSQYGNLPLLQLLSVTGLWGITFLLGWFAAACNALWEEGLDSQRSRAGAWMCAGTIAVVTMLGGVRLALFAPSSQTVRVASISRSMTPPFNNAAVKRLFEGPATSADIAAFRAWATANDDDLLARAEREMQAGAKIVFWGETNAFLLKEEETAFVRRGGDLAAKYHAYLGMAIGVLNLGQRPCCQNKLVLLQPNGHVAWEYDKARPVPGGEAAHQIRGDGKLRVLDTPYGRLSSIICFDADFPQLLGQAGVLGVDILLDPSNDWRAIDPWHTQMANFRAIEQGVNLIRHTSQGLSAAFDYQGRRLGAMDDYKSMDKVMVTEVPTRGARTIYGRLGDWLAWACLASLVFLTLASFSQKRT